ncbi:MAG: GGDEF domain-containing protein [Cyanobacteria bacterium J06639_1]
MDTTEQTLNPATDLRVRLTLSISVTALLFLTPFAINNLLLGRYVLGSGSIAILSILGFSAWSISRGRYYPWVSTFFLAPAILFFLFLAIDLQGIIGYLWAYPAILVLYFLLPERQAWLGNGVLLAIALGKARAALVSPIALRAIITLVLVSMFSAILVRAIASQQRRLEELAVTDTLTGVLNRALLRSTLEQATLQHDRSGVPMSLLAIDLDHFKSINDTLGHDAGDVVLRGVGKLLRDRLRRTDKAFRLGGEEFLLLLYNTRADDAFAVAETLRRDIRGLALLPDRSVTVSVGIATLSANEDWKAWVKRSDENLYKAKTTGRDRVVA